MARRRPLRHVTFTLGLAITVALLAVAGVSLVYTPVDPLAMSMTARLEGPTGGHPFGTDQFGRDILSRVMTGAVTSIAVGVIAVGIGAGIGVLLGLLSGYGGGWPDETLMRLVDAVQGFPAILSALLFTAVFSPGMVVSMVAIGIAFVPAFARLARGAVLELREREFVVAARALGGGDGRLLVRHILPNALPPLIVLVALGIGGAILAEAMVSFLGFGDPKSISWGQMLFFNYQALKVAPWACLAPGAAIFVTVLGFNLLADGLTDAFNPRLRA